MPRSFSNVQFWKNEVVDFKNEIIGKQILTEEGFRDLAKRAKAKPKDHTEYELFVLFRNESANKMEGLNGGSNASQLGILKDVKNLAKSFGASKLLNETEDCINICREQRVNIYYQNLRSATRDVLTYINLMTRDNQGKEGSSTAAKVVFYFSN